jgi:hypothetical protein
MTRRRLVLSGCLAIAAVSATPATTVASASPPEFGRCVKVASGMGTFATGNCTGEGGERKYEWIPGPGPKPGFTLGLKPKTTFFYEAVTSKARLTCVGETGTGDVTGPTAVGNVTLLLTECESGSLACNSAGAGRGEVLLTQGTGTLGVIKAGETPLEDRIGLDLSAEVAVECGGGILRIAIGGVAIGTVSPTHSMTVKRIWKFTESKGFQKPTMLEGGVAESFEWTDNGTPEEVGLTLASSLLTEEKVEINTVV